MVYVIRFIDLPLRYYDINVLYTFKPMKDRIEIFFRNKVSILGPCEYLIGQSGRFDAKDYTIIGEID